MKKLFLSASLLFCVMSTSTWAQDDAATPESPAEATEEDTDSVLDLGTPVDQEPALGSRYSKQTFGDWDLACIRTENETDPCSLFQVMTDDTGNPIAEFSLFRIENGGQAKAGATVVVPLETLLTAQLVIAVDGGSGKRYNYSFCNPIGCVAQIGLTQADVDAFRRGNKATITIIPAPAPEQKVEMDLSLSGFTAGYDAVDVVQQ